MKLRRLTGVEWGLSSDSLAEIYRGVFMSIMLYAAGPWGDLVNSIISRKLLSQQRMALVMLTKAYRTTSTPALQVLAAQLPLDLMVKLRYYMYKVRIKEPFETGQVTFTGVEDDNEIFGSLKHEIHCEWQTRWSIETKGKQTKTFFNNINDRLARSWLKPDSYTSQFMTGHGNFKAKLHELGLTGDAACLCGVPESAEHVLKKCGRYTEERKELLLELEERGHEGWPEGNAALVQDNVIFGKFKKCCGEILKMKEHQG